MSHKAIQAAAPAVSLAVIGFLFGSALVIPVLTWRVLPAVPALGAPPEMLQLAVIHDRSKHAFERSIIARPQIRHPRISHVQITRLHPDGEVGVLTCDAGQNKVVFYTQDSGGIWTETLIGKQRCQEPLFVFFGLPLGMIVLSSPSCLIFLEFH
jgi:hypothetical protein